MRRLLNLVLIACALAGCAAAPPAPNSPNSPDTPDTSPRSFWIAGPTELRYAVTGLSGALPLRGANAELTWWQNGYRYDARLKLEVARLAVFDQHSTGRLGPTGIEPDSYSETRKNPLSAQFLRDQRQVVFSDNALSVPLMEGAQDRLSVMMQLGAMLKANPARYPPGSRIPVQIVGLRDAAVGVFVVGEDETMTLPAGEFVVRKLTRAPRGNAGGTLELWLATAHGYLPVRTRQTYANGDFSDMQLQAPLPIKDR